MGISQIAPVFLLSTGFLAGVGLATYGANLLTEGTSSRRINMDNFEMLLVQRDNRIAAEQAKLKATTQEAKK